MSLPDFQALNERYAAQGLSTFMNPRNTAAGHDPPARPGARRAAAAVAVGLRDRRRRGPRADATSGRRSSGCATTASPSTTRSSCSTTRRRSSSSAWSGSARRGALDFEIDGVVVKVSDFELQRRLGAAGRDPRWAVAWKFPPTTAKTRLLAVHWNVGKFGDLHPFAELEPVRVGGVTVRMATLHNEEDLARKDLREGDEVIVLRAGDVIPQVVSPAPHAVENPDRQPPPRLPARCPICDTPTVKPEGAVFTNCPNLECPGRQWQLLTHFVSRGAMDIDGLGEKNVTLLLERGLVRGAADLYELTRRAAARARRLRRGLGDAPDRRDRRLARAAVRARAVRDRDRGGRRDHRAQPGGAVRRRSTGCSRPRPRRSSRRRASGRRWRRRSPSSSRSRAMRELIERLRAAGLQFAQEGAAARRGAARRAARSCSPGRCRR